MRVLLALTLLTQVALAQGPSNAGLPFSPTSQFSVPTRSIPVSNQEYSSSYYYGYGRGYGYNGYGYGYGNNYNSNYKAGAASYNSSSYDKTYQGYEGQVGARYTRTAPPAHKSGSFPSASEESSLNHW